MNDLREAEMTEPTPIGECLTALASKMHAGPLGDRLPRVRNGDRDPIPAELRFSIGYRDGFRCCWCWSGVNLQLDHVVPWSAGGPDVDTNLRLLCESCNQRRSNFQTDAGTATLDPVTLMCTRCDGGTDDTVRDAFCLVCGRICLTRRDQLRLTARHQWRAEMSWDEWLSLRSRARSGHGWPLRLAEVTW